MSFISSARRSRNGSSQRKISRSSRSRRIGRIQLAFIDTCGACLPGARTRRFQVFAGSQLGCGATRSSSNSLNGCVVSTRISIQSGRRLDSTGWIFTVSTRRSTRCLATLRKSIPKRRNGRACATLVSIISAAIRRSTVTPPPLVRWNLVRTPSSPNWLSCSKKPPNF